MNEISSSIIFVILITSLATYLSRFLGVLSSENINVNSNIFKWFNCIAYAILSALIARMVIFPAGALSESSILIRILVIAAGIIIFFATKKKFSLSNNIVSYNIIIFK